MRTLFLTLFVLFSIPAHAQDWSRYDNARFGFGVDIPPGFVGAGESENGDGQAFKADVTHLREVFPKLPIDLDDNGMLLRPADASSLLIPPKPGRSPKRQASV